MAYSVINLKPHFKVSKFILFFVFIILLSQHLDAQNYEFTLNQRRRFDQIHVEIWAKKIHTDAQKLGYASLVIQYNTNYLLPSSSQQPSETDSLSSDTEKANPIVNINSLFNNNAGYSNLGVQFYGSGFYSLEINLITLNQGGLIPDSTGRGSFIGKIIFDIINDPDDTSKSLIEWSKSEFTGQKVVFNSDSLEITDSINFIDPGYFNVVGVTVLSPNFNSQVVDRDKNYLTLTGKYAGGGYPLFFERTVSPAKFLSPKKTQMTVDADLSYKFDYSIDNGLNWVEIGRVAETEKDASQVGANPKYRTGGIFNPNAIGFFTITSWSGIRISDTNYRKPLRVVWSKDPFFLERSEQAKIKISILSGTVADNLTSRHASSVSDVSNSAFVLGRLFFLQLNGTGQYLKTEESYSNSTQLTVTAWINLNRLNAVGSEPAIIASSLGSDATEINGSTEGAWMLYLKDGRFPAFRVREILGRGEKGYIADLHDVIPFKAVSDSGDLDTGHSKNWMHIAATVRNNEVTLYVNGEIVEKYINLNETDIRMLTTNHPLWIGINPNGIVDANDYLKAGIKEIRVWRTALTQEEIRLRIPGIVDPSNVTEYGDLRRGLELCYSFEGTLGDSASDILMQGGSQFIHFINKNLIDDRNVYYRPDQPHIKLTAPTIHSGVLNKEGEEFEIRWVSNGIGDIKTSGSKDIEIEYTINNGTTWHYAKSPKPVDLAGDNALDAELGKTLWEAWENNNPNANLRSINPYAHKVNLRIRGTASRLQQNLFDTSEVFTVARYFSLYKSEATVVSLDGQNGMNITGDNFFIESWIRPYRFPSEAEGFMTILTKMDSVNNIGHYSLRLLPSGRIQFDITDSAGIIHTALSDNTLPLIRPNSLSIDTAWTHIGVYAALNGGIGNSEIRFYIDGKVQRSSSVSDQLGADLKVNALNNFTTYIGYQPGGNGANGFVGEIRELRFWNGTPNNTSPVGNEPTEMTLFIQGALSIRANELLLNNHSNLVTSFSFNGKSYIYDGYSRALGSETNTSSKLRIHGMPYSYNAVKPYIKLIEPEFKQKVANTRNDLKVRWAGFDFNGEGFVAGGTKISPSLEFSIRGGGGNIIQPYQFISSKYWDSRQSPSINFPETDTFMFNKTGKKIFYASKLDVSKADPDANNDGKFDDQGPVSASLTNVRLRLTGNFTINGENDTLVTEGPLFSITPATNFTIRVLLEGYHDEMLNGKLITNLASNYNSGGIKIKLFTDNAGTLGKLVDSAESLEGYDVLDPENRNKNNFRFANVNFVFTDLADGNYWVLVDQINHLPIMSRFAAPFIYEGDERTTWKIESGWDFTSWNGVDENIMRTYSIEPYLGNLYSAYGDAYSSVSNQRYSSTGLVFNNGRGGGSKNASASMVGGDVTHDGQINAADRFTVRLDEGTGLIRSDITGDGVINADDRSIVDRNFGKITSLHSLKLPGSLISVADKDAFYFISNLDTNLSNKLSNAALKKINEIRTSENFNILNYQDLNIEKSYQKFDKLLAGFNYSVRAIPERKADTINLPIYIRNTGFPFAMANATFAVEYNSNVLNFLNLAGADSVIFSDDTSKGYAPLRTSPRPEAQNPLPNVRTIEIDYDDYAKLPGTQVPLNKFTYLGTLQFLLKQKNSLVKFNWHKSCSVHTTDSLVITEDGTFEEIETLLLYSADLKSPNGGEKFGFERKVNIKWNTDGESYVYLEYSTNAGISWIKINEVPILVKQKFLDWITPEIFSNNYLLRITDSESGKELDRSDDKFSVLPNTASILRPDAFDGLFHGGKSDSIKWESNGYVNIRLEFTSDDGTNWESISPVLDANKGVYKWKIPQVTTKTAFVRIIDIETTDEIAVSDKFIILNGNLQFRTPRKNEIFYTGKTGKITWSSNDIAYFDLQLSTNSGISWNGLESNLLAIRWSHDWDIPKVITADKAILRAIWNADPEMVYAVSDTFSIKSLTSVNDNLPAGYECSEIYPNPGYKKVFVNFLSPVDDNINIEITNSAGSAVNILKNINLPVGLNKVDIDIGGLPSGKYYVAFKGININFIREISIIN